MRVARTLVFAALGMLAFAPPSAAAILSVCSTDSPGPCAVQQLVLRSAGVGIQLYVQGSTGVDVTIEVTGGNIEGFAPNYMEVVEYHTTILVPDPPTTQIHIVGVQDSPTNPLTTFQLGTLTVDATLPSINVKVVEGRGVDALDNMILIDPVVIALPEPAQWLMLTAGSAALTALGQRRSRRAKQRV